MNTLEMLDLEEFKQWQRFQCGLYPALKNHFAKLRDIVRKEATVSKNGIVHGTLPLRAWSYSDSSPDMPGIVWRFFARKFNRLCAENKVPAAFAGTFTRRGVRRQSGKWRDWNASSDEKRNLMKRLAVYEMNKIKARYAKKKH